MIISVISPNHQIGRTTTAAMIAGALSFIGEKRVMLTHVDFSDTQMNELFGIEIADNATTALSHIVKMMQAESLGETDVLNYFQNIEDEKLSLFLAPKSELPEDEIQRMYIYFLQRLSQFDHVVIDLDDRLDSKISDAILKNSGVVVIVGDTDNSNLRKCKEFQNKLNKKYSLTNKKYLYALCRYSPLVSPYQKAASKLNIRKDEVLTIDYTPKLALAKNNGSFIDILKRARVKDKGYINIYNSLATINRILSFDKRKRRNFFSFFRIGGL